MELAEVHLGPVPGICPAPDPTGQVDPLTEGHIWLTGQSLLTSYAWMDR